ncbi:MAG: thermonuclease family protein [Candidatus Saccharimonadales bacterium]
MSRRLFSKRTSSVWLLLASILILIGQHYGWFNKLQKAAETSQPGLYHVVEFVDGDTIVVNMAGSNETLRFIGVDTPETHDPRKAVQCFGQAAAKFTKDLIGSNDVRLASDPLSTNRDRYNRLLRYIYLPDGRLVNAEIIKQGYGFAYLGFPFTKSDEFHHYELDARQANRGLWSACHPTTNQYGGFTSNDAN